MSTTRTTYIAMGSIAIGLAVLALKYIAYEMTGSIALYSDALESVVNVATAVATLVVIRLAARPADASLPYGYHKAEYFSAVMEGVFIIVAAIMIFREAWLGFTSGRVLDAPPEGLAVNLAATALNAVWCLVLLRSGRRARSPALVADGRHLMTDVVSSLGVLGGVVLALVTGLSILDPILAALVALNILYSGYKLIGESVGGLMDAAADGETVESIRALISENADGAIEAHDVRTRVAGRKTFIDFHLVVPAAMSVEDAHGICDRIEAVLAHEITGASVTIHVEPEHKAKQAGIVVL